MWWLFNVGHDTTEDGLETEYSSTKGSKQKGKGREWRRSANRSTTPDPQSSRRNSSKATPSDLTHQHDRKVDQHVSHTAASADRGAKSASNSKKSQNLPARESTDMSELRACVDSLSAPGDGVPDGSHLKSDSNRKLKSQHGGSSSNHQRPSERQSHRRASNSSQDKPHDQRDAHSQRSTRSSAKKDRVKTEDSRLYDPYAKPKKSVRLLSGFVWIVWCGNLTRILLIFLDWSERATAGWPHQTTDQPTAIQKLQPIHSVISIWPRQS